MYSSKFFGSVMILIGTTIGAGMLALPMVGAPSGFVFSAILMTCACIIATMAGLFVVEVNLAMPDHSCSFGSMADRTLGKIGKVVTWIAYLFLLYAITWAYVSGASSLLTETLRTTINLEIKSWIISLSFISIFGIAVFWSTSAVDYFNRGLVGFKGFLLIAVLTFALPHTDFTKLFSSGILDATKTKYLWAAAPIFIASFCAQFVIPSLRLYIGANAKQLRWIVITGSSISLFLYLLWMICTFGTIPIEGEVNSFTSLAKGSSVGQFTQTIITVINNPWVTYSINGFTNIAMTTSFLGVSLALFDFLADGFKRKNTRTGRLQTSLLTFIPPLILAICFPEGFLMAINYASVSLAILIFTLPALMVYYLRKNPNLKSTYRVKCNNFFIFLIAAIGIVLAVLPILSNLGMLPKL